MPTRQAIAALLVLTGVAVALPPPTPIAPPKPLPTPMTPPVKPIAPPKPLPPPTGIGTPVVPPVNPRTGVQPIIVPVPVPVPVPVDGGFGPAEPDRVLSVVSLRNESKKTVKYEFAFNGKYQEYELAPGETRFHASDPCKPDQAPKGRLKFKDGDRERKFTVSGNDAAFADFDAGRLFRFVTNNDGVDFRGAK